MQQWKTSMDSTNFTKITELETPCFILDNEEFERSIYGFKKALDNNFKKSIIGYSVKTNSLPYCLCLARDMGCYAEVVSYDEYELALLCGYSKDHIIYNGPMKSKETFLDAIINGAVVNIETKREIEWLEELPKNNIFNVGIRLNVNISDVSPEDAKTNDDYSRFGFSFESGELTDAINQINLLENVKLCGLHVHRTSKTRSALFYKKLLEYTYNIVEEINLKLDYIDIGGGYFGIFSNAPTYNDYSNAFYEVMSKHGSNDITIIVEPGNGIIASAFSFITSVIDTKKVNDSLIVTTDGSRNDIDPLFSKSNYLKEIIYKNKNSSLISTQIITGATCLEFDKIFTIENSIELQCGDIIKYNNVGAYTMCLTPLFINYYPRVYLYENNTFTLIRDKWTANDYITKSKLI